MELTRRGLSGLLAGLTANVLTPGKALAQETVAATMKEYASQGMALKDTYHNGLHDDPVKRAALQALEDYFQGLPGMQEGSTPSMNTDFRSMSPAAKRAFDKIHHRQCKDNWRLYDLARNKLMGYDADVPQAVPSTGYRLG